MRQERITAMEERRERGNVNEEVLAATRRSEKTKMLKNEGKKR